MGKTENSTPYSPRYGEAETGGTGRLKIFFGYAAGVGKTYAMLEAAHQAQKEGVDVVVGYVEPHARPDTLALLEGLEVLSCREVDYRGIRLREFDLDGALARRPQLIWWMNWLTATPRAAATPSGIRMWRSCCRRGSMSIPQ